MSGTVEVAALRGTVTANSISGLVTVSGNLASATLASVSGRVHYADGEWESVEASAVSGPIRLSSQRPVVSLDAEAVSGSIRFTGSLARNAQVDVESHSGSVELVHPSTTDARFELSSFSGSVTSRLRAMRNEVTSRSRRGPPNESLAFTTGSGSANVTASSFSGSVRILEPGQN